MVTGSEMAEATRCGVAAIATRMKGGVQSNLGRVSALKELSASRARWAVISARTEEHRETRTTVNLHEIARLEDLMALFAKRTPTGRTARAMAWAGISLIHGKETAPTTTELCQKDETATVQRVGETVTPSLLITDRMTSDGAVTVISVASANLNGSTSLCVNRKTCTLSKTSRSGWSR
jgi:hypothetical protein